MSWEMWGVVKPWVLSKVRTEFGLCGVWISIFLDTVIAISGGKPHELIKYESVNE